SKSLQDIPLITMRLRDGEIMMRSSKINAKTSPYQSLKYLSPLASTRSEFRIKSNRNEYQLEKSDNSSQTYSTFSRKNYIPFSREQLKTSESIDSRSFLEPHLLNKSRTAFRQNDINTLQSIRSGSKESNF